MVLDKFIGIVHKFGGESFKGCDCIGLVRLFYRAHDWPQTFTDGKEVTRDWATDGSIKRLMAYLKANFKKVTELTYGDVVLFNVNGELHMGVYLCYGRVLAMEIPVDEGKSKSTIYRENYWKKCFKGGWRRRKP